MKRLLLFILFASAAFAQPVYRIDPNPAVTTSGTVSPGGYPALYALQGANINIYTNPAATTYATTYTDSTGGTACPAYAQVVEPGAICVATAGVTGNFGWWLHAGTYYYTITSGGVVYGPFPITTPIASANPVIVSIGAVCDGTTDDAPIINATTLSYRNVNYVNQVHFLFPTGDKICVIGSPINAYSGQWLDGYGATLKASATFSGAYMIGLQSDGSGKYSTGTIGALNFDDSAIRGLVAIQAVAGNILNSTFTDLVFNTSNGLVCSTYCQSNVFNVFQSQGPMNLLLEIVGNRNQAYGMDVENTTGTTVGCYIQIGVAGMQTTDDNYLYHTLIEGTTSGNKSPLCVTNAFGTVIDDFWFEGHGSPATNGIIVALNNTQNTAFKGRLAYLLNPAVISLVNSWNVSFDKIDISADVYSFYSKITADATSTFTGPWDLQSRNNNDSYVYPFMAFGGASERVYSSALLSNPVAGYSPISQYKDESGSNLLVNGSFEAGNFGWTWNTTSNLTQTFPASAVDQGLMGNFAWSGSGNYTLTQNITVPAAWVGQTMSLSAQVLMTGTFSQVASYLSGAGITQSTSTNMTLAGKWETVSIQFVPQSAGTISVGLWFLGVINGTVANVDDVTVSFGTVSQRYSNKVASLDLGPLYVDTGTAIPTGGPFPVGSTRINTGTVTTGVFAWQCANVAGCTVSGDWLPVAQVVPGNPTPITLYDTPATAANTNIAKTFMVSSFPANHSYTYSWYVALTVVGSGCSGNTTIQVDFQFFDVNAPVSTATISHVVTIAASGNGTLGFVASGTDTAVNHNGGVSYQVENYTAGSGCSVNPTFQLYPTLVQNW